MQNNDVGNASHEAILASVVRSSLDCVIVTDEAGLVVEFNPAAEAAFGYSRAEVIGRQISELIVPRHLRKAYANRFAAYLAGRAPRLLFRGVTPSLRYPYGASGLPSSSRPCGAAISSLIVS